MTPFIQCLLWLLLKIWNCYKFDVHITFLNGDLDEEIFMVQLEGFQVVGAKSKVCRFFKSIYGLYQAICAWNIKFNNFLLHYNFQPSFANPCVYIDINIPKLILAIFLDDGLSGCQQSSKLHEMLIRLNEVFQVNSIPLQLIAMLGCISFATNNHNFSILTMSNIFSACFKSMDFLMPILYLQLLMLILLCIWKWILQIMRLPFHTNR